MKKLIALLLLVSANVHAWDSSSAYNTVAMSSTANSTITQTIVLTAAQQSQSSVNFVVDVKNGGVDQRKIQSRWQQVHTHHKLTRHPLQCICIVQLVR